ncbi:hypothetical protein BU25DRAFT_417611 [Macroventuria anomochaeta]|uniref:Uncharacterized protein n=1 Tax=Macroventuria anomochaeta TaxID=301207 RepID=A0ACB6SHM7_9PLEO|nr:uncharacterized protein BU25DRAFT_417611 [Macroventuria anomochaeta]KAF2633085.1 hypothetical protein BU25DRAFT_417611 [Macroventuria anomochaeta]
MVGDLVCVIYGSELPFILRRRGRRRFTFISRHIAGQFITRDHIFLIGNPSLPSTYFLQKVLHSAEWFQPDPSRTFRLKVQNRHATALFISTTHPHPLLVVVFINVFFHRHPRPRLTHDPATVWTRVRATNSRAIDPQPQALRVKIMLASCNHGSVTNLDGGDGRAADRASLISKDGERGNGLAERIERDPWADGKRELAERIHWYPRTGRFLGFFTWCVLDFGVVFICEIGAEIDRLLCGSGHRLWSDELRLRFHTYRLSEALNKVLKRWERPALLKQWRDRFNEPAKERARDDSGLVGHTPRRRISQSGSSGWSSKPVAT